MVRLGGTACGREVFGVAVAVGDGLLLTAAHVVAGGGEDLRAVTLDGGEHSVTIVAFDPVRDVALLQAPIITLTPLPLGVTGPDEAGTIAMVTTDLQMERVDYRVRRVIKARSTDIYDEGRVVRTALDIDAETGPGASGAPLIDDRGSVVGLVFAASRETGDVTYALHSVEISSFLDSVDASIAVSTGPCR